MPRRSRFVFGLALILGLAAFCRGGTAPAEWHTFSSNGVTLAYTDEGSGDPVVLVHGLGSSADLNWRRPGIIDRLAPHFRVIAFDLRGHGRSARPDDEASYGIQMSEDVGRLLDHLHIASAHIVGYSLGGIVALKFVAMHPDRVRSATLGGMGCLLEGSPLQALWEHLPQRSGARTPPACVHSVSQLALTPEAIRQIKVPVKILVGERDPIRRLYVEPLQQIRPDWPVTTIAGAGHVNCIVKPQFQSELVRWLEQQRARPND